MESVPPHISPPDNIELKPSSVNQTRIGAFCVRSIPKDAVFGPYSGRIVYDQNDGEVEPNFSWEVFDLDTFKFLHIVDATDPMDGNWMRYVCCARFFEEQNIVSTQNGQEVFYKALKDIEPGHELLTWFQPKKKKRRKDSTRQSTEKRSQTKRDVVNNSYEATETTVTGGKRKRKPKIIPDSYDGPLDYEMRITKTSVNDEMFEPLQPGQKRRRRKKFSADSRTSSTTSLELEESDKVAQADSIKSETVEPPEATIDEDSRTDSIISTSTSVSGADKQSRDGKKENGVAMSISEINNTVDWVFPPKGQEYYFEMKSHNVELMFGKKMYRCDICLGLYRHMFSLKRHYLRNHVNYRYLSKADMTNCLINLAQVVQNMRDRGLETNSSVERKNNLSAHEIHGHLDYSGTKLKNPDKNLDKSDTKLKNLDKNLNNSSDTEKVHEHDDKCSRDRKQDVIENEKNALGDLNAIKTSDNKYSSIENSAGENTESNNVNKNKNNADTAEQIKEGDKVENMEDNDNEIDSESNEDTERKKIGASDKNTDSKPGEVQMPSNQKVVNYNNDSVDSTVSEFNEKSGSDSVLSENNTETENSESALSETRNKLQNMPGLFRCYTCYDVFDDVESVREHVQNHPKLDGATVFSCDRCNMRFNFKQNLVRHQRVHEREGGSHINDKTNEDEASSPGTENDSVLSTDREPAGPGIGSPPIQSSMYQVFRCSKCKTKYETLEEMTAHVQAEHITGSQYQCQYCGKEFPSMPNMKKHVRFHLGYRVSCRLCTDVFPNVGALRKHTRIAHTEAYKAKQLEKLGKLGTDKKVGDKVKSETITKTKLINSVSTLKPSVTDTKTEKPEDTFPFDHDINFAADEIDDGGSRFKFSCTVCKKRFSNYINMCRHRRKSHSHDSKQRHEELSLNFNRNNRSRNLSPVAEDPAEVARFYANISHNIATNLNCYIDGHKDALEKFVDHIKIEDYSGNFGFDQPQSDSVNLSWENYNFPPNFKPLTVVPVPEPSEQESVPESSASEQSVPKSSASEPSVSKRSVFEPSVSEPNDPEPSVDSVTKEALAVNTHLDKTESKERGDKIKPTSEEITVSDKSEHSEVSIESIEMGTMSGLRNLAAVAAAVSEKRQNNKMDSESANQYIQLKITGGVIHKARVEKQTFSQIQNGEYANFEDDLSPSDISYAQRPESKAKAKFEQYRECGRKRALGQSSESVVSMKSTGRISPTNHELFSGAAQAELSDLYSSIDSPPSVHEEETEQIVIVKTYTPQSLSGMCENVLGIKPGKVSQKETKQNVTIEDSDGDSEDFRNESALLSELSLASQRTASMKLNNGSKKVVPDYSDVPHGSPFYNYDSIAFGRNGEVVSVCAICRRHFKDIEGVVRHHWKKHAGSVFQILEVEQGHEIDALHFTQPSYTGALAVTDPGLDSLNDMETFTCTKCGGLFRSVSKLHVHIVTCSPIDPVNGYSKVDKSPSKTSLTKRIQQKFNNLLATDQLAKAKMFAMRNGLPFEPKSRKRMFTGCRKRKSVLLPDSPIKTALLTAHLSDLRTGYNPDRHIRRRELTELVDTLTCEACGLKFKTIILLERHVKNCTKKEKFKNVQPLACPIMDESLARIKNICFYCEKNFTYTKSLINHFQDFCPVKKAKKDRGDLSANDKLREDEIVDRLKRMEDEKLARDAEHVKKKITWQVGRKPKRKGHSWTCIKKRKQGLSAESLDPDEAEGGVDEVAIEETEQSDNEEAMEDGEQSPNHLRGDTTGALDSSGDNVMDSLSDEKVCNGYDEVDSVSDIPDGKLSLESKHELEETLVESERNEAKGYTFPNMDEIHETSVNDTSLNCTARYQVNQIVTHKQKKTTNSSTAAKPSLIFQCVSNEQGGKGNEYEPLVQRRLKESSSLIIESKRKRERVSKVEEFLRNAFRRRRRGKKQEEVSDEAKDGESDSQASDMTPEYHNDNFTENKHTDKIATDDIITEAQVENDVNDFSGPHCDRLPNALLNDRGGPRKRGRAKKISVETPKNNNDVIEMPRKRGRPRKPLASPVLSHSSVLSQRGKVVGRPPHSYVPRQRGRPPKWKRLLWSLQREGKLKNDNDKKSVDSSDDNPLIDSVAECKSESNMVEGVENQQSHGHITDQPEEPYDILEDDKILEEIKQDMVEIKNEEREENRDENETPDKMTQCLKARTDHSSKDVKHIEETATVETTDMERENSCGTVHVEENNITASLTGNEDTSVLDSDIQVKCEPEVTYEDQLEEHIMSDNSKKSSVQKELKDTESRAETSNPEDYVITDPINYTNEDPDESHDEPVSNSTWEVIGEAQLEVESAEANILDSSSDILVPEEVKQEMVVTHHDIVVLNPEKDGSIHNDELCKEKVNTVSNSDHVQGCGKQYEDPKCETPEGSLSLISKESTIEIENNETSTLTIESDDINKSISEPSKIENVADVKPELTLPKSPEPSFCDWFPPVLSPSERVKMNKRSCTSREPNTPVWVKKPTKPKVKPTVSDSKLLATGQEKIVSKSDSEIRKVSHKPSQESDAINSSDSLRNKKPLFKKRVEAINENLKLLNKKVNSGYNIGGLPSPSSVFAKTEEGEDKPPIEDLSKEARSLKISQLGSNKGVKRKQSDDADAKANSDERQAKRTLVAEKIKKLSDQVNKDTKSSKNSSREESKSRLLTKDKKTSKVKAGKR